MVRRDPITCPCSALSLQPVAHVSLRRMTSETHGDRAGLDHARRGRA